ncbi:MCS1B-like protein [Mya arenaria]|uniref:MCS1B-like protein n=1 Tax=Mya arenaria TaxID=6604 RepID=A0ABY7DRI3_MYAAR|nr:MCS1B-like protein [Mya arenaria]
MLDDLPAGDMSLVLISEDFSRPSFALTLATFCSRLTGLVDFLPAQIVARARILSSDLDADMIASSLARSGSPLSLSAVAACFSSYKFLFIYSEQFDDKENVSGVNNAKSSVQRGVRQSIISQFPFIESYLDQILPKKDAMKIVKCHEHIEILANQAGEPIRL